MSSEAFSGRRIAWLALVACFAVALVWPVIYTGHFFVFADTASYFRGGVKIWGVVLDQIQSFVNHGEITEPMKAVSGDTAVNSLEINDRGRNVAGRSFTYSAFVTLFHAVSGLTGTVLAQAVLVAAMIALMVSPEARQSPLFLALGAAVLLAFTGLPWFSSYLMPDIFGAFIVMFGIILVHDLDRFGFWQATLLIALTGFAATTHYGNLPLILAIVVAALGIRLLRRRLSWKSLVVGLLGLAAAPLVNVGGNTVAFDEGSVAPKRLPIILARSLADGPALWYLEDVCPEAGYALCEAYGDEFITDTKTFLWSDKGVLALPTEQLERIRAEEFRVVLGAFLAYPVEQTKAILGNGTIQLIRVGTDGLLPAQGLDRNFDPIQPENNDALEFRFKFDELVPLATLASLVVFAVAAVIFGLSSRWFDMLAIAGIGLVVNAYIYGGLSAPIDRYQGRVAWIIPLLLFLYLAERASRRRAAGEPG